MRGDGVETSDDKARAGSGAFENQGNVFSPAESPPSVQFVLGTSPGALYMERSDGPHGRPKRWSTEVTGSALERTQEL